MGRKGRRLIIKRGHWGPTPGGHTVGSLYRQWTGDSMISEEHVDIGLFSIEGLLLGYG